MYNNNNKIANISNSELTFFYVCVCVYALDKRTKNLQRCQLGAGLSHLYTHIQANTNPRDRRRDMANQVQTLPSVGWSDLKQIGPQF